MDINYNKLKKYMNSKKISNREMANKLNIHITTFSRKINNHQSFTAEELLTMTAILGVNVSQVVSFSIAEMRIIEKSGESK
ncbi:MAG: helix-turn-helix domain-containing protein [Acholeplasmataceae bacterium]